MPMVDRCCGWHGLSEMVHALPCECGQVSHKTSMIHLRHVQTFVAPITTNYSIIAVGASGGTFDDTTGGGTGANLTTIVTLKAGTILNVVVGGMGGSSYITAGGGGGGASFVFVPSASAPLIVAGTNLYALWPGITREYRVCFSIRFYANLKLGGCTLSTRSML